MKRKSWKGCKPNFVYTASGGEDHLSIATLPGAVTVSDRRTDRPWPPIWPCTRWGLPCRLACAWRGGLLPHLFTLTPANRGGLFSVALSVDGSFRNRRLRVSLAEPGLRSIASCGVRTFLSRHKNESDPPPFQGGVSIEDFGVFLKAEIQEVFRISPNPIP